MKFVSKSLAETEKIVAQILKKISGHKKMATVLLLEGDLGSGKTTFTQFLAKLLGVKRPITSPTFVLMKKYEILQNKISPCVASAKQGNFKHLIHIDAYRLNSGQELKALGWDELVSEPANLIVLEWPERVVDIFTGAETKINFKFVDENTREMALI